VREVLTIGRREACDICLRFPDVSSVHAQLSFHEGYWRIRDMNSTNGIKVNGVRVLEKLLHPQDEVSIGRRRKFTIVYELPASRRALEEVEEDLLGPSLLEKAGLEVPKHLKGKGKGKAKSADSGEVALDGDKG
jgi:adenylate cyclase